MTTSPRILITGANGKTGRATLMALLKQPEVQIRALVRKDDLRARALAEAGAEVVIGNMADVRDMRRAMLDVQRAYFVAPLTNNSLDHAMNFAVAAEEARLEHVVAISQWLASPAHASVLTRRAWLIDRLMAWLPGIEHTLINVGWFADNYMTSIGVAAQLGILPLPVGSATNAPISNEDIGRVIAGVLVDPSTYGGRTLRPTGPEFLSPEQIADAFATVLGRKVRYLAADDRMFNKTLSAMMPDRFAQAQVVSYMHEYRRGSFAVGGLTDVVQEVTGRPAEDFTSILRRYAASDPLARRSVANTLRVLAGMVRIMVASPLNIGRWEAQQGMARISDPEDCVDSSEWTRTHSVPNAFSVPAGDAARRSPPAVLRTSA